MANAATSFGLSPVSGPPALDGSDCVTCGRCCHHGPRTVHLLESDEQRLGPRRLEIYTDLEASPPYFRFIKNSGHRCGALDVTVPDRYPCAIYDGRPDDCRIVEPGSPACLEARRLGHLGSSIEFFAPPTDP
jgi:uncharacterized protein